MKRDGYTKYQEHVYLRKLGSRVLTKCILSGNSLRGLIPLGGTL